ncbi:hypothetical protein, partial [Ralstonia pseudosolanacearum]
KVDRVKPDRPRQRGISSAELDNGKPGRQVGSNTSLMTSTIPTARCGPACRVVWEGSGREARPYPDRGPRIMNHGQDVIWPSIMDRFRLTRHAILM